MREQLVQPPEQIEKRTPPPETPAGFERDVFLLRPKGVSVKESYYIADEHGNEIFYADRRPSGGKAFAIFGGIAAAVAVVVAFQALAGRTSGALEAIFASGQAIAAILTYFVVSRLLWERLHVVLSPKDARHDLPLKILQDKKPSVLRASYTVVGPDGSVIARLVKRYISGVIRSRWDAYDARGDHVCVIREESGGAVVRRILGTMFGVLRTNFLIVTPQGQPLGTFYRQQTLLDRHVLDMRNDQARSVDRRIALAIGLTLDAREG